jgi:hypothetical protein
MNWSIGEMEYWDIALKPALQHSNTPEKLEQNSQFAGRKNLK